MRKIAIVCAALLTTTAFADGDMDALKAELQSLKSQVAELKKNQESANLSAMAKQLNELKTKTGGDNIKWSVDYRTTMDSIQYKMDGKATDGLNSMFMSQAMSQMQGKPVQVAIPIPGLPTKASNDSLLTNRLTLGMKAAPRSDLSFIGKLSYNKVFGDTANHSQGNSPFGAGYANFDWVTNENALDNTLKVKEAYWIYFGEMGKVNYTASIGRRPSYDGLLISNREDDAENSPIASIINVEYDGASFRFDLDKVTGVSGMYFKLCMGRGLTNAKPRFTFSGMGTDYSKDNTVNKNVDLAGFIFVPYDNGQYAVHSMFFKAWDMIGFTYGDMFKWQAYNTPVYDGKQYTNQNYDPAKIMGYMATGKMPANGFGLSDSYPNPYAYNPAFQSVGNLYGGTIALTANGIGDGISPILDDTKAFVSWAFSKTDPNGNTRTMKFDAMGRPMPNQVAGMLGSEKSQVGTSWYAGVQLPIMVTKEGKLGLEYNHGSKWWRSISYGEDTLAGSKIATRGNAYEAYLTQPIFKEFTAQVRYTYMKYDYTGSNLFFGQEGAPMTFAEAQAQGQNPVKTASDLRLMLRYRY